MAEATAPWVAQLAGAQTPHVEPITTLPRDPGLHHGEGGSGPRGQQGRAQALGRRLSPAPLLKAPDEVVLVGQRRAWCWCYRLAVWRHTWRSIPVQIVCTSTWWHVPLQNKTHPINVRNEPSETCPSCWLPVKGEKYYDLLKIWEEGEVELIALPVPSLQVVTPPNCSWR